MFFKDTMCIFDTVKAFCHSTIYRQYKMYHSFLRFYHFTGPCALVVLNSNIMKLKVLVLYSEC